MNAVNLNTPSWTLVAVTAPLVLIAIGLVFLSVMRYIQKPEKVIKKFEWLRTFYVWIGALAVLGGAWAFLFPLAITADFGKDGDGAALRQMLIYTTGGVLGVITLGENHRKNSLEKTKNDQDHTRQVHAERRIRYTKAIEHLFNENISVRLGGVYTLAGLADEWLSDEKTLPNEEERRKETQNIINNLCAYIRSPFPLAERAEQLDKPYAKYLQKDFDGDKEKFDADKRTFAQEKAALEEERQVRKSIIKEIRERLQDIGSPGPWSKFDYDFSNALFFYSTSFMFSHFNAFTNFHGATFARSADFSLVTFAQSADFSLVTFAQSADFYRATFENKPIFEYTIDNKTYKARFSCKADPRNYNFEFSDYSPYKIDTKEQEYNGIKFIIPKDAELFDPDIPHNQDRIRQIHAERRNRYTTAIEQLSNETPSIRLGGVYSLVGLVDEWLADEIATPNIEERRKEGQVIINNLCAYIRSPFLLAERAEQLDKPYAKDLQKDFSGYTEKFEADKQIFTRDKAALKEERQVRSAILQNIHDRLQSGSKPGPWSDFEYNFSNAKFFYPVNFESSHFCIFLDFSGVTLTEKADLSKVTFTGETDFSGVTFAKTASFSAAIFIQITVFSGAKFTENANFSEAQFTRNAVFSGAQFTRNADFSGAKFTRNADFSGAQFTRNADFSGAKFTRNADFSGAKFSHKVDPEDYNFDVSSNSHKIETEEQEHNSVNFTIPKGATLFDPDDLSKQEDNGDSQRYTPHKMTN